MVHYDNCHGFVDTGVARQIKPSHLMHGVFENFGQVWVQLAGQYAKLMGKVDNGGGSTKLDTQNLLQASLAGIENSGALSVRSKEIIDEEVDRRLEALRCLGEAAEAERRCMGREEFFMRAHLLTIDLQRTETKAFQQRLFSRDYGKLMMLINNPPHLLVRLRFMMGNELDGGATMIICQDPASLRNYDVVTTPLL